MTLTEDAKKAIVDLAEDLRSTVEKIEKSIHTTLYHYGDYLAIFSQVAKKQSTSDFVMLALITAGANEDGVKWAYRIHSGNQDLINKIFK